ncbi:MAG: Fic family protein [Synergistaceae bacterium]|nr:Fic family protein [Synergistaceae bacterium]
MKFPVNEKDLQHNYKTIMSEVDKLSFERRAQIWADWPKILKNAGSWECLKNLHIRLFGGLFDFAGKIRKTNISKGGVKFANAMYIENILPSVISMPQKTFDEIVSKYVEMNILHPFREGNGRTMRLWLDAMLERELNTRINWPIIGRDVYLEAMERSPVNTLELVTLLKKSCLSSDLLKDESIFIAALSASYEYEYGD